MDKEIKLIIPILPGKAEAWRRFLQELEGSWSDEFTAWCQAIGVQVETVLMHDTLGGSVAVLSLMIADPERVADHLANSQNPFNRWFYRQINILHGLDLSRMNHRSTSSQMVEL